MYHIGGEKSVFVINLTSRAKLVTYRPINPSWDMCFMHSLKDVMFVPGVYRVSFLTFKSVNSQVMHWDWSVVTHFTWPPSVSMSLFNSLLMKKVTCIAHDRAVMQCENEYRSVFNAIDPFIPVSLYFAPLTFRMNAMHMRLWGTVTKITTWRHVCYVFRYTTLFNWRVKKYPSSF